VILTLLAIAWQSAETREAAKATQASVEGVKRQADLMERQIELGINKERARIRIDLDSAIDTVPNEISNYGVLATVSMYGPTEAFIDKTEFEAIVGDYMGTNFPESRWRGVMDIPSIINPGTPPIQVCAPVKKGDACIKAEGYWDILKRNEDFIFAIGAVYYTDRFDRKWVLRFSKRWTFTRIPLKTGGWGGQLGYWEEFGKAEANGEYEIKSQNPN